MFWWVEQKLILAWVIEMVLDGFISQKLDNWALPSQAKQGRKSLLCGVVVSWLLQYQRMFWHHCSSLKLHLSGYTYLFKSTYVLAGWLKIQPLLIVLHSSLWPFNRLIISDHLSTYISRVTLKHLEFAGISHVIMRNAPNKEKRFPEEILLYTHHIYFWRGPLLKYLNGKLFPHILS